ncbi:uncharacterized protein FIESC28_02109 [Fusarium coffeatum]|uniref:Uncharacterized protein n=1 Tax=Fusarium coffeatum TaxID=231269 RepID=A0A366S798_9HYPO|nr:uncharacterized protein FIESC28_02109 [Fusarium coffeatum]RBR25201.1 hypothetical protein FIESC28_02109 [Fusarium coffeatum]
MESTDIRRIFELERDAQAAATRLANFPPKGLKMKKSSGIDCLVVIIRHIYCNGMMSPNLDQELEWFKDSEAKNPILGHAWHVFGNEKAEIERSTKDRDNVNVDLGRMGFRDPPSFMEICDSNLMNETFWSQDIFRLSHPPVDPTTGDDIPLSANEIAELSKLVFIPEAPGSCIQDVVNQAFGHKKWKGREMFVVPHKPWAVRVLYRVDKNLCDVVSIKQLKTLTLPVWNQREDVEYVCFEETSRVDYFLMGIVLLREQRGHPDLVRTYSPFGQNVPGAYETPSYVKDGWSVAESGTYMLFYGIQNEDIGNTDVTDFAEVAGTIQDGGRLDMLTHTLEKTKMIVKAREEKVSAASNPPPPPPSEPQPPRPSEPEGQSLEPDTEIPTGPRNPGRNETRPFGNNGQRRHPQKQNRGVNRGKGTGKNRFNRRRDDDAREQRRA